MALRRSVQRVEESSSEEEDVPPRPVAGKKRGRPSQTQKQNMRAPNLDEDDDEDGTVVGKKKSRGGASKLRDQDIKKKAAEMVRLALCNEMSRKPLKRDDINKKVLGNASRSFNVVFKAANKICKETLGMELVELRPRGQELEGEQEGNRNEQSESKSKSVPKTYMLRSNLLLKAIAAAAEIPNEPLPRDQLQARRDQVELTVYGEGDAGVPKVPVQEVKEWSMDDGTVFDWKRGDQLQHMGLLHVVLALILANGRILGDVQLLSYMRRLSLRNDSFIPTNPSVAPSGGGKFTLVRFLDHLTVQGYLERDVNQAVATQGGSTQSRRPRSQATLENAPSKGDPTIEWRWGPRAEAEIGEVNVYAFIQSFYLKPPSADDVMTPVNRAAEDKKVKDRLLKDLTRASGRNELKDPRGLKPQSV